MLEGYPRFAVLLSRHMQGSALPTFRLWSECVREFRNGVSTISPSMRRGLHAGSLVRGWGPPPTSRGCLFEGGQERRV